MVNRLKLFVYTKLLQISAIVQVLVHNQVDVTESQVAVVNAVVITMAALGRRTVELDDGWLNVARGLMIRFRFDGCI